MGYISERLQPKYKKQRGNFRLQAIYGYGQVKLKVNWLDTFEKSKIWLKC